MATGKKAKRVVEAEGIAHVAATFNNTTVTIAYVGSEGRHLGVVVFPDSSTALLPPGVNNIPYEPFPAFGSIHGLTFGAESSYNSGQVKIERHFQNGLSFLGSYPLSHSLDDSREPLPDSFDGGDRNYNILGISPDYGDSPFDVRQRFTFTGTYELPFGRGRKYLNSYSGVGSGIMNAVVGGWNDTIVFLSQTECQTALDQFLLPSLAQPIGIS